MFKWNLTAGHLLELAFSWSKIPCRLIQVVPGIDSLFLSILSSSPWYVCPTICLTIRLLDALKVYYLYWEYTKFAKDKNITEDGLFIQNCTTQEKMFYHELHSKAQKKRIRILKTDNRTMIIRPQTLCFIDKQRCKILS